MIRCKDQKGIVAAVSEFLFSYQGNILEIDQHVDEEIGMFFMRAAWELESFALKKEEIEPIFEAKVAKMFEMEFELYFNLK